MLKTFENYNIYTCNYNQIQTCRLITMVLKNINVHRYTQHILDPENIDENLKRSASEIVISFNDELISIFNTHLGLKHEHRLLQIEGLCNILNETKNNFILSGDFNWSAFMDDQSGIISEVRNMEIYQSLLKCCSNSIGNKGFGLELSGTFIGFENDFFVKQGNITSFDTLSSLQDVFYKNMEYRSYNIYIPDGETDINKIRKDLFTDHLPIEVEFK